MSVATSPFRCAGPMPATIPLDPVTALDAPSARWSVPSACRHVCYILPISPECRCAGRILSASYPSSNSAPPSNPHSARCTTGANFPRLRALALFGRRPPQRVEEFVMPASKNLHNSRHGQQGCLRRRRFLVGTIKILTTTRHVALELKIRRMAISAAMAVWCLAARRCSE